MLRSALGKFVSRTGITMASRALDLSPSASPDCRSWASSPDGDGTAWTANCECIVFASPTDGRHRDGGPADRLHSSACSRSAGCACPAARSAVYRTSGFDVSLNPLADGDTAGALRPAARSCRAAD
eukprot:scaffold145213_cov31-Tisochrysis_lutea.AAC.1